jgi:hypothetical protein
MNTHSSLTKKQIKETLGCPGYIIDYLYDCGRLPVVRASKGKGYPRLYDTKAIEIVKDHLRKNILK